MSKSRNYPVSNNIHHDYIYYEALRKTKTKIVTELHDFSLHHLVTELTLRHGDFEDTEKL